MDDLARRITLCFLRRGIPSGEITMPMARQAVRQVSAIDTLTLGERKLARQSDINCRI
jgi:hypothetical protein